MSMSKRTVFLQIIPANHGGLLQVSKQISDKGIMLTNACHANHIEKKVSYLLYGI